MTVLVTGVRSIVGSVISRSSVGIVVTLISVQIRDVEGYMMIRHCVRVYERIFSLIILKVRQICD